MKHYLRSTALGAIAVTSCLLKQESDKECNELTVDWTEINSGKIKNGHRLVFLTDLHDKEFGKDNCQLVEQIRKINPDLILIGGDMMNIKNGRGNLCVTDKLLSTLCEIAPIVYGNGNHEMRMIWPKHADKYRELNEEFGRMISKYKICYLNDRSVEFGDIVIHGLNIDEDYFNVGIHKKMEASYIREHLGNTSKDKYNILLSHSPLFFQAYAEWGADLTLAGHFHGGIIRLPGGRGIISSQMKPFEKYCSGEFNAGGKKMIVSRGLGTHTVNIRINNKPQIVVISLKRKEADFGD